MVAFIGLLLISSPLMILVELKYIDIEEEKHVYLSGNLSLYTIGVFV